MAKHSVLKAINHALVHTQDYLMAQATWETRINICFGAVLGPVADGFSLSNTQLQNTLEEANVWELLSSYLMEQAFSTQWQAEPEDPADDNAKQNESLISMVGYYLKRRGWREKPMAKQYLNHLNRQRQQLWQITAAEPGQSLTLRHAFNNKQIVIKEKAHSNYAEVGDFLHGHVLQIGNNWTFGATVLPINADKGRFIQSIFTDGYASASPEEKYQQDEQLSIMAAATFTEEVVANVTGLAFDHEKAAMHGYDLDEEDWDEGKWDENEAPNSMARAMSQQIKTQLDSFFQANPQATMEDANAAMTEYVAQLNNAPVEDFLGLSPAQVEELSQSPLINSIVTPNLTTKASTDNLAAYYMYAILELANQDPIKLTAKGNLPLKFCQQLLLDANRHCQLNIDERYLKIRSEQDYTLLHALRLAMEEAGYLDTSKTRSKITQQGKDLLAHRTTSKALVDIMQAFVDSLNWGAFGRFDYDITGIQDNMTFALYLLYKNQHHTYTVGDFVAQLHTALPMLKLDTWEPDNHLAADYIDHLVRYQLLEVFGELFGLCKVHQQGRFASDDDRIQILPYFHQLFNWHP